MSYLHFLTITESYKTSYFSGWNGSEPIISENDSENLVSDDIGEISEDYYRLEESGLTAEIETCWVLNNHQKGR